MTLRQYLKHVGPQISAIKEVFQRKYVGTYYSWRDDSFEIVKEGEQKCLWLYDDGELASKYPLDQEIEFSDNDVLATNSEGDKCQLTFFASFVIARPDLSGQNYI